MNIKKKNKVISNVFLGLAVIFEGIFVLGLLSILFILISLIEGNINDIIIFMLLFVADLVIIFPLLYLFVVLSLEFDPDPPKTEYIDYSQSPYKDWY